MKRMFFVLATLSAIFCSALPSNPSVAETIERQSNNGPLDIVARTETHFTHALTRTTTEELRKRSHGQRFVEFRGEMVAFPGNTVVRHGFLGPDGEPDEYEALSFRPRHGLLGLLVGNVVPYPSELGTYPWDDLSAMQIYRVRITKHQHERLIAYIDKTRQEQRPFYLYTDNCVRFARGAARAIGLKAPEGTFVFPAIYVNMLRIANEGHGEIVIR